MVQHIKSVMKLRKDKSKNVKVWKEAVQGVKTLAGSVPGILVREYSAVTGEAKYYNKQYYEGWTICVPLYEAADFDEDGSLRGEFDVEFPKLRDCAVRQPDWDWADDALKDIKERQSESGYKENREDQLNLARATEIQSWPKTVRKALMPEAALQLAESDSSRFVKFAATVLKWSRNSDTSKDDEALEQTHSALKEVIEFLTAYEAVAVPQVLDEGQAAALRKFFIPSSYPNGKQPKHVKAWADAANAAPGFSGKVRATVDAVKLDLGIDGISVRAARDCAVDKWKQADAWEWLSKLAHWQKKFRPGSLETVEGKLTSWVQTQAAELSAETAGETDNEEKSRCEKLAKLSEVMSALNAVSKNAIDKTTVETVQSAIVVLQNKSVVSTIKTAADTGSQATLLSEDFMKAVRSQAGKKLRKEVQRDMEICRTGLFDLLLEWCSDDTFVLPSWETHLNKMLESLKAIYGCLEPEEDLALDEVIKVTNASIQFKQAFQAWSGKKQQGTWGKLITAAKEYDKKCTLVAQMEGKDRYVVRLGGALKEAQKVSWEEYAAEVQSKLKARNESSEGALSEAEALMNGTADGSKWDGWEMDNLEDAMRSFKKQVAKNSASLYKVAVAPKKLEEDRALRMLLDTTSTYLLTGSGGTMS